MGTQFAPWMVDSNWLIHYRSANRADLISACGRVKNTAKESQPALA